MTTWPKENNTDKALKIILFLISPFIAFLYSLRTIKTKSSYTVFFLFCVFFGLSFSVSLGKSEENRADGASYREKFELYKYVSDSEFYKRFNEYFTFEEGANDYCFDTVAFYVSRVTDNYHITSLGGRFMVLAYPVIAYIWLVNFKAVKYDKVLHTMPLVFLFSFYTQFLLYKNVLSPTFYFSSPFYLLYKYF